MKTNHVSQKIPALRGRDAKTNVRILELLALEGSQTTYNINKLLGRSRSLYPTIFRAVTKLKKRGYIAKTGTVRMTKKRWERTPIYGLTWRGFITSLTSDKVCADILNVCEKNPQLQFPLPREVALAIAKILGNERLEKLARSLLEGFLKAIPNDIESMEEKEYPLYIVPALGKVPSRLEEIKIEQKDLVRIVEILRNHPNALDWFEEKVECDIKTIEQSLESAKRWRDLIYAIKRGEIEKLLGLGR